MDGKLLSVTSCLFLAKVSKDLQVSDFDEIVAVVVLSRLFETEEAGSFARDIGNLEVPSHARAVQVVVFVSTVNFGPQEPVV